MDILFRESKYKATAALIAFMACVLMVALPEISLLSAQKGIALWAGNVLPALLPFFICAGFMSSLGISNYLPRGVFVFLMSVFSGYPMGAKLIGDMRRRGEIDLNTARRMLSYCSTSGPAFILGAVGVGMLGSVRMGAVITISHYAAALLTGVVFSILVPAGSPQRKNAAPVSGSMKSESLLETFTNSIFEALKSLGIVLAYIVLFMFITDLIGHFGIIDFLESDNLKALFKGMIEMTVGCSSVSALPISLDMRTLIISFLVSFGGLSVIGQSMSMLSGSGISLLYFAAVKLCHGLIAAGISFLIMLL